MKKITLVFSALFIAFASFSQDYENVVKLKQTWLLNSVPKKLGIVYERGLSDNLSAYVDVGYLFPKSLIKDYEVPQWFRDAFAYPYDQFETIAIGNGADQVDLTMQNLKFSGWNAAIGARFYPQSEAIKRFYLGAKFGYTKTGFLNMDGVDQNTFDYSGDFKVNFLNASIELGNQYIIADVVSIDWTILGLGFSSMKVKANYTTTDPDRDLEADKLAIDNWFATTLNLPAGDTQNIHEVTITDRVLDIDLANVLLPMVRFGVTVGYVF